MNICSRNGIAVAIVTLGGIVMLPGCSGPQEDVRITFCKKMTNKLLEPVGEVEWQTSKSEIKRPEYARIDVRLTTQDHAGKAMSLQASCFYAYDAGDENAMTQSDPLSAYSTLPYKMILNDQNISTATLNQTIRAVQLQMGQEAVEKVRQGVNDGLQQLKSGIGKESSQ